MGRPSRASRAAPAAAKQASSAVAPATRSIDSFGRISKRVAPSSLKKVAAATATTISSGRQEAVERFLADKKKEEEKLETKPKTKTTAGLPSAAPAPQQQTKTPTKPSSSSIVVSSTKQRKRRAAEAIDDDCSPPSSSAPSSALQQPTPAKRARRTATKATTSVADLLARAAQKKVTVLLPAVDSDSDSPPSSLDDKTGNLIARLNLNFTSSLSTSPSPPRSTSSSPRPNSTAPTTPCESENECEDAKTTSASTSAAVPAVLPLELLELIRLQTAFAKTLAVHHAHHGTNAPVDLRAFCPGVAQAWGKRKVTLEDVQRCLGVVATTTTTTTMTTTTAGRSDSITDALFLSDYSRGKICIEVQPNVTGPIGTLADQLSAVFEANLRARWATATRKSTKANAVDPKHFIETLPKVPITKCASLLQTSALRAKGQRTLEELMHGIALKKQEKEAQEALLKAPVPVPASVAVEAMEVDDVSVAAATTLSSAVAPPMNLLDRIRFRQMQRAQLQASGGLAAPPTPEELERRAALQRVGDIAEVLSMLCTAASLRQSNRVSFGMTAIVSKVKDSLRMPIAREEAVACVRLLSKEVAPQWLQMVSMGGREIVIMMADAVPSKMALQDRVQSLTR